MEALGIAITIIWTIGLILALIVDDKTVYKIDFIIAYIVLMIQFIEDYFV